MTIRAAWSAVAASFALLGASPQSLAQAYPAKPVRIIVTFTTGGAADLTARIIGERLAQQWSQQVVVENRIGAGGNIGVEAVFKSPADGYTLLLLSNTHAINQALYPKLPFDLVRDFATIGLTTSTVLALAVHPKVPATSLQEFTAMLRAQPGKLSYATCGVATVHHLAMELYKIATKTFAVHIPHRGCTPAVIDAVGGQVEVVLSSLPTILPHAKAGRLRALAVTSKERSSAAPDIPTFREVGLAELNDYEVENYYGLMAPGGTPREIVAKLEADVATALGSSEVRQRLAGAGIDLFPLDAAKTVALLRADIERFRRIIAQSGIKPE